MHIFDWNAFKSATFPALKALAKGPTGPDRYHAVESRLGKDGLKLVTVMEPDFQLLDDAATYIETLGSIYFAELYGRGKADCCTVDVVAKVGNSLRMFSIVPVTDALQQSA